MSGLARVAWELGAWRPGLVLVAWEEAQVLRLCQAVREATGPKRILLVIGPEGGITPAECTALEAKGAKCITLGRRILRTETAGLAAIAALQTLWGDWGGQDV